MVCGRFIFKGNKRFDSLSWSEVVRYFYTRNGKIIGGIERGTRAGLASAKEEVVDSLFPLVL